MRRKYTGWLVCAAAAVIICAGVVMYERSYADWGLAHMLCDGCFAAGVALTGLGALAWVASFGGFNALGYGWYLLVRMFSFSKEKFADRMSYVEYVQQKRREEKTPPCLLVTGLVCIAAAFLFLFLC